jgi:hypothetical protein
VKPKTRRETDGGGVVSDGTENTSRALLRPGRILEQVKFKETIKTEKFYAYITLILEYIIIHQPAMKVFFHRICGASVKILNTT